MSVGSRRTQASPVSVPETSWSSPARIVLWALPIAVGIWLRSVGLEGQVFVGDERWEISAALERSLPELFQHFLIFGANYSPPLAAVHRLLLQSGFEPGELALRAPIWLCGVLLLVGMPLVLRRRLPFSIVYPLCWLLAISPQLVFYSRMVRGYVPLVLLGTVATWAALRCIETGSRRAGLLYALSSGLMVCMHLLAFPFVVAPLAYAGVRLWLRPGHDGLTPRSWFGLGLAVAVAILLFVGPAWRSILWLLEQLGGQGRPDLSGLIATLARLAGVGSTGLAFLFWGVAAVGVWRLFALAPRLAGLGLTQLITQIVAVSLIGSLGSESEILLTRFVMVVLPLLLLFTAAGLSTRAHAGSLMRAGSSLLAGAFVLVFYLSGPLVQTGFREGSFAHEWAHRSWRDYDVRSIDLGDESFYASLREPGRGGTVIETLWHGVAFPDIAPAHQRIHGQPVMVASLVDSWWADPRLSLRNSLGSRGYPPQDFLQSEGRWVVVHLDPRAESMQVRGAESSRWARSQQRPVQELARRQELLSRGLAKKLERAWGEPDYQDRWIAAWDLARIRAEP